ncbi:HpcH/HpaI aldolase family protein [Dactylosporangium sp. CA-233914]|uniref:HpcH/HpaI aldolase family protein n=1 Tax=Dactylosporangium sp. CA-233914 TaxID=3239934 RepID=UPI003D8BE34B
MPNPVAAEAAGRAGFDWIGIDTQHGLIGYDMLLHMLQAIAVSGTPGVVRVSGNSLPEIGRALDSGAQGVIVPLIETAEQAQQAAYACRYPPSGGRSWGAMRPMLEHVPYSPSLGDELAVCFAMVETETGVNNIDEIVAVDGLDVVYVGPSDLAASAGLPPQLAVQPGRHQELVERIAVACRKAGRWSGIHPSSADVAWYRDQGFSLFPIYRDLAAFQEGCTTSLALARASLARQDPGLQRVGSADLFY